MQINHVSYDVKRSVDPGSGADETVTVSVHISVDSLEAGEIVAKAVCSMVAREIRRRADEKADAVRLP